MVVCSVSSPVAGADLDLICALGMSGTNDPFYEQDTVFMDMAMTTVSCLRRFPHRGFVSLNLRLPGARESHSETAGVS